MIQEFTNSLGEKIIVMPFDDYNLKSTDINGYNENFKYINPFDLNVSENYPYKDEEKNKVAFLEIDINYFNDEKEIIIVAFKTKEYPDSYEKYGVELDLTESNQEINDKHAVLNKNQLVLMNGISLIVLDIDTLEVIKYTSSDKINNYGYSIYYKNNMYIVKDITGNYTFFDEKLNEIIDNY